MRKKLLSPYFWLSILLVIGAFIINEYRFRNIDYLTKMEKNNLNLLFTIMISGSMSMNGLNILKNEEQKTNKIALYIIFGMAFLLLFQGIYFYVLMR